MNTKNKFHLTALAFGVLIATSVHAEANQVYSYTVSAHNAPITVDVILKDGKIANILTDNRESPGVGKLAIANLSKKIIRNQTINVDNVSGASVTSMALKYAVKKNLEAAGADLSKFQAKLPKAQLKDSYSTEVVIVGGSGAGLAAAASVIEAGGTAIIVEKLGYLGGSTVVSGGGYNAVDPERQNRQNIEDSIDRHFQDTMRGGHNKNNPELVKKLVEEAPTTMHWLESKGLGFWPKVRVIVGGLYPRGHSAEGGGYGYVKVLEKFIKAYPDKVKVFTDTQAVKLIKNEAGKVIGVVGKQDGKTVNFMARKGVIIATGCYGSNEEMRKAFAPYSLHADAKIYFPTKSNTGDAHIMAMQAGGVMQKNDNHAATVHLEAGAGSYGFLHVNANGERFMNEDVNTQSKSCSKELQPHGIAWTVYDSNWTQDVKKQVDGNLAGGLFYGQMWQPWGNGWNVEIEKASQAQHIKDGKVVVADTLDELAQKMGVPVEALKATVTRYNELAAKGHDDDFGKRPELLTPIQKGPFYAGRLVSTLLAMSGGLHTDPSLHVLDKNDKPIEGLYVCGAAAGDYFGSGDYPTICPGMNHGRALTFGRLTGVMAAGGDIDKTVKSMEIK